MPKKTPTARRVPQRLAATHMRRSMAKRGPAGSSGVCSGGMVFMRILLGQFTQQVFELVDHCVGRKVGDARMRGATHVADQAGVGGKHHGGIDEMALVAGLDAIAV